MNDIRADAQNEVVINPALKSLLQQTQDEKPHAHFTHRIMAQIEGMGYKNAYQPIISKSVWYWIAAAAAVLIVSLGFSERASNPPQIVARYFIDLGNELSTVFSSINTIPSVYLLTVIAVSILLLTDYYLRNERFSQTK